MVESQMAFWALILFGAASVVIIVTTLLLIVLMLGLYRRIMRIEELTMAGIRMEQNAVSMFAVLARTLLRYETHLGRWYNTATGLEWSQDAETARYLRELEKLSVGEKNSDA